MKVPFTERLNTCRVTAEALESLSDDTDLRLQLPVELQLRLISGPPFIL